MKHSNEAEQQAISSFMWRMNGVFIKLTQWNGNLYGGNINSNYH